MQTFTDIGMKRINEEDDLELVVNERFFENMAREVDEKCPILKEIIQVLATGTRDDRNTGEKKQLINLNQHSILSLHWMI